MASVDIDYDRIDEDKETKHAIYVVIQDDVMDTIAVWLPKSQIEVDEKRKIITMPEWLAEEKNLDFDLISEPDGPDEGDRFSIY